MGYGRQRVDGDIATVVHWAKADRGFACKAPMALSKALEAGELTEVNDDD